MANKQETTTMATTDIKYATFLKAAGVPFVDCVDEESGVRKKFVFEKVEGLRDLRNQFYSRKPDKLAALTLFDEYDALKALTHMRD